VPIRRPPQVGSIVHVTTDVLCEGVELLVSYPSAKTAASWAHTFTAHARAESLRILRLRSELGLSAEDMDGHETAEYTVDVSSWSSKVLSESVVGMSGVEDMSTSDKEGALEILERLDPGAKVLVALCVLQEVGRLPPQFRPASKGGGEQVGG
jgi:hypothetical protein